MSCDVDEVTESLEYELCFGICFISLVSAFSQKNKTYKIGSMYVCVCVSMCVRVSV